jgi:hypothetical protein
MHAITQHQSNALKNLKVVEDRTIKEENRLAKQVHELKSKNEDSKYISKGKLRELMEKNQEKD